MSYSIQEMKNSGFTYYEIIDTADKCRTIFTTKNYSKALVHLRLLEANK